jgi:hypothetical protein
MKEGINLNWRINMKRIVVTGIILVLVMFAVTCEAGFPKEEEVDYTDVVYSEDGTLITLYLDGVGIPVTKEQRAMTRNLAMMAYDYLEVVFINAGTIARTSWELGQAAGISGVKRDVEYPAVTDACIFVGMKGDKTLLGVGKIVSVFPSNSVGPTNIATATRTVTFEVASILTGLCVWDKNAASPGREIPPVTGPALTAAQIAAAPALFDSFDWAAGGSVPSALYPKPADSSRFALGSVKYPIYTLPSDPLSDGETVNATYKFSTYGTAANFIPGIKHWEDAISKPLVQMRMPRYMDGGRYLQPKANINTDSIISIDSYIAAATDDTEFDPVVPIEFTIFGSGIFSFYLQIPVFMVTKDEATNGGTEAEKWFIRTGLGSELYSLDSGKNSGGCVLMGIGVSDLDWLEIQWDFIP